MNKQKESVNIALIVLLSLFVAASGWWYLNVRSKSSSDVSVPYAEETTPLEDSAASAGTSTTTTTHADQPASKPQPAPANQPVLAIKSLELPAVTVSYTNLPLANIRLKNAAGEYIGKDIAGSVGTGVMTDILPAVDFKAGTYTAEAVTADGIVVAKSEPRYITNRTGDLYLGYKNTKFPPISDLPQGVARALCGLVYGDSCAWAGMFIGQGPFYLFGNASSQTVLDILSPESGQTLTMGKTYTISFTNDWVVGRYRAYLVHKNLIGEVNEVHQLHIVNAFQNGTQNLVIDLNEETLDANGGTHITPVQAGTYELVVADVDTGIEGGVQGTIQIRAAGYVPFTGTLKPYAANTPLINSYWNGGGVFMNGNAGEDTLQMTGKRSDFAIYKGVDMPNLGQYDAVVFFRRIDNVVIIMVNTEIVKFDDQTIRTTDLIQQLH